MIKALYTAATGMQAQQTRIDVIANNLANVNTSGFKRSTASFQDLLYSHVAEAGTSNADGSTRPNGLELGSGSRLVSTSKVFTPGVLERTGRELDLVISGGGFFKLQDLTGNSVYTRDGSFHVDGEGNVVNSQGLKMDPAITVEPGASIGISADGTVTSTVGDRSSQVGRINLVRFANPSGLKSLGANTLQLTDASGAEVTGFPGDEGFGTMTQGFIERSNVQVVDELVNLITSQRAYEINSRAISAADQMLTTVNNILQ